MQILNRGHTSLTSPLQPQKNTNWSKEKESAHHTLRKKKTRGPHPFLNSPEHPPTRFQTRQSNRILHMSSSSCWFLPTGHMATRRQDNFQCCPSQEVEWGCQTCRWLGGLFMRVWVGPVAALCHARHLIHKHASGPWMLWVGGGGG